MHTHHLQEYKVWTSFLHAKNKSAYWLVTFLITNYINYNMLEEIHLPSFDIWSRTETVWLNWIWRQSDGAHMFVFAHGSSHTAWCGFQLKYAGLCHLLWLDGSCMHIMYPDLLKAFLSLHNLSAEEMIHCCSRFLFCSPFLAVTTPVQRG